MKTNFHKLIALASALSFSTVLGYASGKNVLDISSFGEATVLVKVLNKELGLNEQQKVRIEKLLEAYVRRVELAKIAYADNQEQLKKRITLLNNYRNETLKKELGDEKAALFEMMLPQLPKKIAEMNKLISGK